MFKSFVDGFKAFADKKTPFVLLILIAIFFASNYVTNTIIEELPVGVSLNEYPSFLINYFGIDLFWLALLMFAIFFFTNYAIYLISSIITKTNKNALSDIPTCLLYSFFVWLLLFAMCFLLYLSAVYLGVIGIILNIVLAIVIFVISLITALGIVFLPVSKNIKDALSKAWVFLKKNFWGFVLLALILLVISYLAEYLFTFLFLSQAYDETLANILYSIGNALVTIYLIAVLSAFIKKKKKPF